MKNLPSVVLCILLLGCAMESYSATPAAEKTTSSTTASASKSKDPVLAYRAGQYDVALKEFKLSAEKGSAVAQYYLGGMYYHGQGVTQNYPTAYMWMSLAKEGGSYPAIDSLKLIKSKMDKSQISKGDELLKKWKAAHKSSTPTPNKK